MKIRKATVLLLVVSASAGCYRYVPSDPAAVEVGSQMRAILTPAEAQRMRTVLATGDTLVLGTVTAVSPEAFEFRVAGVNLQRRSTVEPLYQSVSVARRDITEIQTRELDRPRTLIAAVGGAVLAGIVLHAIWEHTLNRDEAEPPGPDEARLPVVRIPISIPLPLPKR